ncbi:MAG TPA: integrase, partial [Crocinitomix sp.]|nr:integrase [Crocinitomix sp.]
YKKDIEQFFEKIPFTENELNKISYKNIRAYLVDMVEDGLENSSVNRKLSSLKTFFKYLKRQGEIEVNPMIKISGLKNKKRLPQFVPENQLWDETIFKDFEDRFTNLRDQLILELFYQTGIRLSELINLKEKNVSKNQLKVLGKRNKERIIPITNQLHTLIYKYQLEKNNLCLTSELLIISKKNKKLTQKFVYTKVNYYLSKVTNLKKKSPHVLRHTFATHMLNNGASLESIKKILGHTDLVATQVYTHNSFKQIKTIYKSSHPRGGE